MTGGQLIQHVGKVQNTGALKTRLGELRDIGVVTELGTVSCPITGRRVILWDVTSKLPTNFEKPHKEKCKTCGGRGYIVTQQTKMF